MGVLTRGVREILRERKSHPRTGSQLSDVFYVARGQK